MKYFTCFLLLATTLFCKAQNVSPDSAKFYEGKIISVCGEVKQVNTSSQKTTYINFGEVYPNATFTVVVFSDSTLNFSYPLESLKGKNVCVTGLLKLYKGRPQIIIEHSEQIEIRKPTE